MSLTGSYGCWLSLTVFLSAIELLHVSHLLPWLLAVFSSPMELLAVSVSPVRWSCYMSLTVSSISMELLHVSLYLSWLLAVFSSSMELLALSVSPVPWSCYMSLTVSYGCWLSLTYPPSSMELLNVSH